MASEMKATSLDFGIVIAFVAPGFVTLCAVAYDLPTANAWIVAASDKDQNVGVFLFALLASLSLGITVSGVRAIVVDNVLTSPLLGRYAVQRLHLNWQHLDNDTLARLVTLRDNYFRYYQFYSNTLCALILWSVARLDSDTPAVGWKVKLFVLTAMAALLFSARHTLALYHKGANQLSGLPAAAPGHRTKP